LRAPGPPGLHKQGKHLLGALFVQRVAQIAVTSFGLDARGPQRLVQLGGEDVLRVRLGSDTQELHMLDLLQDIDPAAPVPDEKGLLVRNPCAPAGAWRKEVPGSVLKRRDLALAAFPCSGGWGCDDVPVTLGR